MSNQDPNNQYPLLNIQDEVTDFVLYTAPNSKVKVEVLLSNETIWLTQKRLAELFGVTVPTINEYLKNILKNKELDDKAVIRKFRTTAKDGKSYNTNYYNLDAVISVGYRVNSVQATQFRIWATSLLKEYIIKGFTMDSFSESVNKFLAFNEYKVLEGYGKISRQQAENKAFSEYEKFNKTQKINSDFDKKTKALLKVKMKRDTDE